MSLRRRPDLECDAPGCRAVLHGGRLLDRLGPPDQERDLLAEARQFGWSEVPIPDGPDGPARTVHYCPMHRDLSREKTP